MSQPVGRPDAQRRRHELLARHGWRAKSLYAALWSLALFAVALGSVITAGNVSAAPASSLPTDASCAVLSRVDASATNGSDWGRTILPGHNVPGGWFGVDVCANGTNVSAPNGSNVSCDRVPTNWGSSGCTPGVATSDGYGLTYQCVELVIRFSSWAYGDAVGDWGRLGWGNAPDLWLAGNHPSDFVMYPNGSSTAPMPGDILVWGSVDAKGQPMPAGSDGQHGGHIAVVAAVHGTTVVTAEQNVKWGNQDHPSDTLALTHVGDRWILSGSMAHQTTLPTYRWRGTMGTSRATYGWLHSKKYTGKFPSHGSSGKVTTPTPHSPTATPTHTPTQTPPKQSSGGLPSLAQNVFVANGGLIDLVWSSNGPFDGASSADAPSARTRSLGAPPGAQLADGQRPAVVTQSDGKRFVYVLGADGHLYQATTSPIALGVQWQDLGAPSKVTLGGSASATLFTGGIAVAVLGSDGNLWWRAGPAGDLGGWLEVSIPPNITLSDAFALIAAPGVGEPMLVALGKDGVLYQRIWQPALLDQSGGQQAPAGWSDWATPHAMPAGVRLVAPLLTSYETTADRATVAPWLSTPLDLIVADDAGHLWGLRATTRALDWTQIALTPPSHMRSLLGVAVTQSAAASRPGSSGLNFTLYVSTDSGVARGSIALPQRGGNALGSATWTDLTTASPTGAASESAQALPIGPDSSALLLVRDGKVLAASDSISEQVLRSDLTSAAPKTPSATQWITLGSTAAPATFNDSFTSASLDDRWTQTGSGLSARMASGGLQLSTADGSAGALLQSAAPGNVALEVRVTLPSANNSTQRAGLIMYLDDGDWMTLALNAQGRASYCVVVAGRAIPCATAQIGSHGAPHVVWLQIARAGDTYTALASPDQGEWTQVGQWTIQMTGGQQAGPPAGTPSTTPSPTAGSNTDTRRGQMPRPSTLYAIAPLAFSQWGVYVQGAEHGGAFATFADFLTSQLPVNVGTQ